MFGSLGCVEMTGRPHGAMWCTAVGVLVPSARDLDELLANSGAPEWTERDALTWWEHHLPHSSSLRSFARAPMRTPPVVQKV